MRLSPVDLLVTLVCVSIALFALIEAVQEL